MVQSARYSAIRLRGAVRSAAHNVRDSSSCNYTNKQRVCGRALGGEWRWERIGGRIKPIPYWRGARLIIRMRHFDSA
jgi:hypothetical protein